MSTNNQNRSRREYENSRARSERQQDAYSVRRSGQAQGDARARAQYSSGRHVSNNGRPSGAHNQNAYAQGARQGAQRPVYQDARRPAQRQTKHPVPKRRRSKTPIVIGVIVAVAVILGVWFLIPKNIDVTLNGQKVGTTTATTAEQLLADNNVELVPGNLLAVDGEVLTQGGGEPGVILANGEAIPYDTRCTADMVIETAVGADTTEEYTASEQVIPYSTTGDDRSFSNYWGGSIHLLADGKDGLMTVKTGTTSGKTVEEVTVPVQDGGYQVYTAQPSDPVIALTFDDGPWSETTSEILDILEQYNAKATFFTIGCQIADHPEDIQRAVNLGCEVCTHTWDHADGSGGGTNICNMSADEQIEEVTKGYAAIAEVTGTEPPHIMRAPGGNFYDEAIDNLWPYLDAEIGWDVDTEDWRKPGADTIASRIESVEPGQVVLMHDGGGDRSQTVEALRMAMPVLVEKGYRFVTVSELLAYGNPETQQTTA